MTIREQSLHLLRQVLQLQDEHGRAAVAAHIAHVIDMLEAEEDEGPTTNSPPDGDAPNSLQ